MVYLTYSEGSGKTAAEGDTAGTAAGRGRLSKDMTRLEDFEVIFRQQPKLSVGNHFGARMVFDRDGYLFIALGENNDRPTAQDLDKLQGKIVRIYPDGSVPKDNPLSGRKTSGRDLVLRPSQPAGRSAQPVDRYVVDQRAWAQGRR